MNTGRITAGIILILAGIVLLIRVFGIADITWVFNLWPLVLIIIGAAQMIDSRRVSFWPMALIAAGCVLLLSTFGYVRMRTLFMIGGPVALIAIGLWVLVFQGRVSSGEVTDGNAIDVFVAFGGREISVRSDAFRGGPITALFGGVELDLTGARLDRDGATLEMVAMFGGVEIKVPRGWKVEQSGPSIFGGFSDETPKGETLPANAPVLKIHALTLFGGGSIEN